MKFDIIIAGVGGQGVVLASRLLATAAMDAGYHVATAETIGMAQREGSVTSHVRIGEDVCGSLIPHGKADLLIGLEPAEAARNILFLGKDGNMLVNEHAIMPSTQGFDEYDPETILKFLKDSCPQTITADFTGLARDAGTYKAANVAMIAAAAGAGLLPFSEEYLWGVLEKMIPEKYREVNRRVFDNAIESVSGKSEKSGKEANEAK
ncbi:indolepyruvate ferredoxin oxidoreductase beta subunit [Methanolobus vulcani]|uniref:Indolepyruvate ferredoxin oxidoreductase beta subunit n=1 Tax=Methanolobus vulcani TaxID=38026 RepID=A0A7Z7AXG2_9EURY|nr:indolepyruvate oxidoreductase subunit beta [Methanolobus vulcani]SDG02213.1 indolepyruvate ferredoxin oxidoreductase beta subunit [Methanolobus vulcani]